MEWLCGSTEAWERLLLGVWLILTGVAGLVAIPLPAVVMAVLALIAGVLILAGR